jgi:dTDP-4-amino-4,6-dideoxygalactose transaminase
LTNQPVYASWCNEDDYPVAQWINQGGFYIGCHHHLTPAHIEYVIDAFREYYG